jgi:transposase-like protein
MGGRWKETRALGWKERLAAQQRSGLSIAEFCRREGIAPPSFYVWRKRLSLGGENRAAEEKSRRARAGGQRSQAEAEARRARASSGLLVPVRLAPEPEAASGVRIELPGGAVLTLPADASAELVTTAIRAAMGTHGGGEPSSC